MKDVAKALLAFILASLTFPAFAYDEINTTFLRNKERTYNHGGDYLETESFTATEDRLIVGYSYACGVMEVHDYVECVIQIGFNPSFVVNQGGIPWSIQQNGGNDVFAFSQLRVDTNDDNGPKEDNRVGPVFFPVGMGINWDNDETIYAHLTTGGSRWIANKWEVIIYWIERPVE